LYFQTAIKIVREAEISLDLCSGFSQDRVSFLQNPGSGTAGRADPTWPNRAGYSIPCAVMLGSGGGELGSGNSLAARECAAAVRERAALFCGLCSAGLFCVFPLYVSLVSLFPLFAVLLNCPYPDPPVFCLFLSILLCITAGGGAAAWRFCCRSQPNHNNFYYSSVRRYKGILNEIFCTILILKYKDLKSELYRITILSQTSLINIKRDCLQI